MQGSLLLVHLPQLLIHWGKKNIKEKKASVHTLLLQNIDAHRLHKDDVKNLAFF